MSTLKEEQLITLSPTGQVTVAHDKTELTRAQILSIVEAVKAQAYKEGYLQGKFDTEVTAEYGEPKVALQSKTDSYIRLVKLTDKISIK